MSNPFQAIADSAPVFASDAKVLAQAFVCVHNEWEELFAILRYVRRSGNMGAGSMTGWLDGKHFQAFNRDDQQDVETLRDMAHEYLEGLAS